MNMPPERRPRRRRGGDALSPRPQQAEKPLTPPPDARRSRVGRRRRAVPDTSSQEETHFENTEKQQERQATPEPPVESAPENVPQPAEVIDVESGEEEEGGVELLGEGDPESSNNRSMSASTSGTQLEADALDATLAIEAIPALHRKSTEIFDFLGSQQAAQLLKKVRQPGNSAGRRLDVITKDFSVTKELFATTTEFIKIGVSTQVLQTDNFAPLICKANFAALALGLFRTIGHSNEAVQYLLGLEAYFPKVFFLDPGDLKQNVKAQVNKLMLEIRTQLFIAAVYYEQDVPLDNVLRQIFLEAKADLESNEEDGIHEAWAMGCKPKGWDTLTTEEKRSYKARIGGLRRAYVTIVAGEDRVEPLDTEYLTQNWPWDKFVEEMMKFITVQTVAINRTTDIKSLVEIAEIARARGLRETEEEEDASRAGDESGSALEDADPAADANWLTDQSRTLVDPETSMEHNAPAGNSGRKKKTTGRSERCVAAHAAA